MSNLIPLTNCHYPGVDSVPVGRHARVFVNARANLPPLQYDRPFPVAGHQHQYDLMIGALTSGVTNVHFYKEVLQFHSKGSTSQQRASLCEGVIRTPLTSPNSHPRWIPMGSPRDYHVVHEEMIPGDLHFMKAEEFHTMECELGSAWLVVECGYVKGVPRALSPVPYINEYRDLYQPMPIEQADWYKEFFTDLIKHLELDGVLEV